MVIIHNEHYNHLLLNSNRRLDENKKTYFILMLIVVSKEHGVSQKAAKDSVLHMGLLY